MPWLNKLKIDPFLITMLLVIGIASIFPCEGEVKVGFKYLTVAAIALLFFMHGAKLSREAIMAGIRHWRLHLLVFSSTFIVFPILGLGMHFMVPEWMSPTVYMGFLYLCALPATVQSAIAFTSVAGGNVAAAVCSASASSILGVFLSPILVGMLMDADGSQAVDTFNAIGSILLQLMLPFVVGHLARPLIEKWINRHRKLINITDRSSILLVVYVAFSEAVVEGIWQKIDAFSLLMICVVSCLLLLVIIVMNIAAARLLKFSKPDEITIVFCGSKKSLANGVPMANVLFPASVVGVILLPLMIFHQIQLMVCAVLAQRYANQGAKQKAE
ncbi:bile acid:sodium symporter family protein [Moellerella wisconsensis]|uniref:Bile acid:sodium symporter n=1 Tax=Moellerella wisconsensis TaxID=158849 RepID=A0ACD3Y404_9GAMM|nr:bile acid:sodium symporter family protein [Moellerella wisconsensis]UNH37533.1 bile acid:sodium symporter [Moellerella wisconsensis]